MKYLLWQGENHWHISRPDGLLDDNVKNNLTFEEAIGYCEDKKLDYEIVRKVERTTQELRFEE